MYFYLFVSVWGHISVAVRPINAKVCTIVDLSFGQVFFRFCGDNFRGHRMHDEKGRGGWFFGF